MSLRIANQFIPTAAKWPSLRSLVNGVARNDLGQASSSAQNFVNTPAIQPILSHSKEASTWIRQQFNAGLATLAENPVINQIMRRFSPQIERSKDVLFKNWNSISSGFQKIGEAFGFVSDAQLKRVYEPMRMVYQDQVTALERGMAFDVGSGILGLLVAGINPIAWLTGMELPLLVAVPTISAGMSILSRGASGVLTKTQSLRHARAGLKRLTQITGA